MLYWEESYKIVGCAMKVHSELGPGFLEAVYQEALEIMFQREGIPYKREPIFAVEFMGTVLSKNHVPDFTCYDKIVVELKALDSITGNNKAQVISYLKVTGYELGILLNFGARSLEQKRLVRHPD